MIYLLLCIVCSTLLIFAFKYFHRYNVSVSQAIFFNYVTCTILGAFVFGNSLSNILKAGLTAPWVLIGMACGFLFFVTFYLIAASARNAGVAATSVAQKVSLVIPVAASLLFWQKDPVSFLTVTGLFMAVTAVVLTSRKRKADTIENEKKPGNVWAPLLPAFVFLNAGLVDSLINFANFRFLRPELEPAFTMVVFGTAALLGFAVQIYEGLINKKKIEIKSIVAGILLGIPNLLTLIFLLKALTAFQHDGAFVYPINNMGVIILSTFGGILLFGERLRKLNWLGLGLGILALALLLADEF